MPVELTREVNALKTQLLRQHLEQLPLQVLGVLPLDEPKVFGVRVGEDLLPDLVSACTGRAPVEPFSQKQIVSFLLDLPAPDCQFGVAWPNTGKLGLHALRLDRAHDIEEGPPRTYRRELPRVPN